MNIQILDSWLREYLKTKASPKQIAEKLSLTSVSIERIEKWRDDFLYDIEITSNRPDLASVTGLAREAGAVLPQSGTDATFVPPIFSSSEAPAKSRSNYDDGSRQARTITIEDKTNKINRICGAVMEVSVKDSPKEIQDRLESSGIRSLNNLIDITNYVMRVTGHPVHVFDYDRLGTNKLILREAKKGETIVTLDKKVYTLSAGDLIADDGTGRIVDLLSIMGLDNSVTCYDTIV